MERSAKRELEIKRASLDMQVALGQMTKAEEASALLAFTRQQQQTEMAALNNAISLLGEGTTARAEALRQSERLEQDFQAAAMRLRAQELRETQQNAHQQAQAYMQAFSSVSTSFRSAVTGMLMGTTTWQKATQMVLQSVAGGFLELGMKLLGDWIATQVAMTMVSSAQGAVRNAIATGQSGLGALASAILGEWLGIETAKTAISTGAETVRSGEKIAADAATTAIGAATLATNTWYSVWIIYNGTTVAGLLSTSATAPTLPSGYTYKARVGWVRSKRNGPGGYGPALHSWTSEGAASSRRVLPQLNIPGHSAAWQA